MSNNLFINKICNINLFCFFIVYLRVIKVINYYYCFVMRYYVYVQPHLFYTKRYYYNGTA